jgi:hypothetical protein
LLVISALRNNYLVGEEGGTLRRRLRKPKKPNEKGFVNGPAFVFVATIVDHLLCDRNQSNLIEFPFKNVDPVSPLLA